MKFNNNTQAFFSLVKAGLWEGGNVNYNLNHNLFEGVDWGVVYRLAEEQAVVGLVAAGIDHVVDVKVPQAWALQFAGQTIQLVY